MNPTTTPDLIPIQAEAHAPRTIQRPSPQQFSRRARRLRHLAEGHSLGDYLQFCAQLADAQQAIVDQHPDPLPLTALLSQLAHACAPQLNAASQTAVQHLLQHDENALNALANALAAGEIPDDPALLSGLPLLGAAQQIQKFTTVNQQSLPTPSEQSSSCPCCGGPAVATVLRANEQGHAVCFGSCALCACEWPLSRIQCRHCGNTKDLQYRSLASKDAVRPSADSKESHHAQAAQTLECCDACHGALKQVSALKDPDAEAVADDLASLALDVLAAEEGYGRIGFNPYFVSQAS